ncbi:MAG: class I SAM-dependent methyltransferase [Syntrophobacteraceae bacterium]
MEGDILQRELEYHKKVAQKATEALGPVPNYVVDRYSKNKRKRYFSKESVFSAIHDFSVGKKELLACDCGCGDGRSTCEFALVFPELRVIGIDVSPELIYVARRNAEVNGVSDRVEFVLGDVERNFFDHEIFDIMVVLNVLHHVDIEMALPNILRAVKSRGMVIFREPVAFSPSLQRIRDIVPVKKDVSPDERQLIKREVDYLICSLENVQTRYYTLFERLERFLPNRNKIDKGHPITKTVLTFLCGTDQLLFYLFPILVKFAGLVLIIGNKPAV